MGKELFLQDTSVHPAASVLPEQLPLALAAAADPCVSASLGSLLSRGPWRSRKG